MSSWSRNATSEPRASSRPPISRGRHPRLILSYVYDLSPNCAPLPRSRRSSRRRSPGTRSADASDPSAPDRFGHVRGAVVDRDHCADRCGRHASVSGSDSVERRRIGRARDYGCRAPPILPDADRGRRSGPRAVSVGCVGASRSAPGRYALARRLDVRARCPLPGRVSGRESRSWPASYTDGEPTSCRRTWSTGRSSAWRPLAWPARRSP